jgi:hypothetical protein
MRDDREIADENGVHGGWLILDFSRAFDPSPRSSIASIIHRLDHPRLDHPRLDLASLAFLIYPHHPERGQ